MLHLRFNDKALAVKTTPAMSLQAVIEQGRQHFKIDPSVRLQLKEQTRKAAVLDPSLTVRLANISSGAKFDLVALEGSSGDLTITVALQVASDRYTDTISLQSTSTIWDVLVHFQKKHQIDICKSSVVVLVLGKEFNADLCNATTLTQLGCQQGAKVLFRVSFKSQGTSVSVPSTSFVQSVVPAQKVVPVQPSKPVQQVQPVQTQEPFKLKADGSREYKVYVANQQIKASDVQVPDNFYDLSSQELKSMVKIKKEEPLLLTQALRDRQQQEREGKHPNSVIRLKFPSAIMVEAKFSSQDYVKDVYAFAQTLVKDVPFYLYTTPPLVKLQDYEATLYKCGFVPGAILNVNIDNFNNSMLVDGIVSQIVELPVHPSLTEWINPAHNQTLEVKQDAQNEPEEKEEDKKSESTKKDLHFRNNHDTKSKLPKWLKLGK